MGRSWQAQSYPRRPDVRLKPIDITLLVGELLDGAQYDTAVVFRRPHSPECSNWSR